MEYKQINDYETLYLIKDNNETAYDMIFSKYRPIITNFAYDFYKKFHNLGIEYDDLYQEGMIGLSEAIKNYNVNNSNTFYTFSILCIKREMQRLIIHYTRGKNMILNSAKSIENSLFEGGITFEDTLYDERNLIDFLVEESAFLKRIINLKYDLNINYMPIFELKVNGFSNTEIAKLLDIPYKKVDNALYNIKKSLKKLLNSTI